MKEECYKEYKLHRKKISVELPKNTSLPFLAYGFFKPRQQHILKSKVTFLINLKV